MRRSSSTRSPTTYARQNISHALADSHTHACPSHPSCWSNHAAVAVPLIFQSHPSRCIPLAVSSLLHPLLSSNRQSMMREWTHCLSSTSGDSRAWAFHVHPHPIPLQFKLPALHYALSSTATLLLPSIIHVLHASSQSITIACNSGFHHDFVLKILPWLPFLSVSSI